MTTKTKVPFTSGFRTSHSDYIKGVFLDEGSSRLYVAFGTGEIWYKYDGDPDPLVEMYELLLNATQSQESLYDTWHGNLHTVKRMTSCGRFGYDSDLEFVWEQTAPQPEEGALISDLVGNSYGPSVQFEARENTTSVWDAGILVSDVNQISSGVIQGLRRFTLSGSVLPDVDLGHDIEVEIFAASVEDALRTHAAQMDRYVPGVPFKIKAVTQHFE